MYKVPENPELVDLLELYKKDIMLSMNCHAIAKVESFDPVDQTVTASMMYKKTFLVEVENTNTNESTGQDEFKKELRDYPLLVDCPVIVLNGGKVSLKMPIKKGDECLILFNDRSIDRWFESGQVLGTEESRLHSFTDGIALVGLSSSESSLEGYVDNKAVLGDETANLTVGDSEASLNVGDSKVKVGAKVNIENSAQNLNTLLQSLITQIQLITVVNGAGVTGPPLNAAAIAAIGVQIGALLE